MLYFLLCSYNYWVQSIIYHLNWKHWRHKLNILATKHSRKLSPFEEKYISEEIIIAKETILKALENTIKANDNKSIQDYSILIFFVFSTFFFAALSTGLNWAFTSIENSEGLSSISWPPSIHNYFMKYLKKQ